MSYFFRLSRRKGFTLLELLVVISIIGILITMGAVAFSTAQKKGRDAKRRGDIKAMQNAFEQYYAQNSSAYNATCNTMLTSTYMPGGAPVDPKTGSAYTCAASTTAYCVCATLEDITGGNANAPGGATCNYASGGSRYCLSNLQ